MSIVHLCDDLIFASRVAGTARDCGLSCATARDAKSLLNLAMEPGLTCAILDLANPGLRLPEVLTAIGALPKRPRVIAYGSHVDAIGLRAARDAGCDVVLPRSQFVALLPNELTTWATEP